MECGCHPTRPAPAAGFAGYDAGLDALPDPLSGGYASPLVVVAVPVPLSFPGVRADTPSVVQTSFIGPTRPPIALDQCLSRRMAVSDFCTPFTGWMHNYGFQEIDDTQKPGLEFPRYSYAALSQDELIDEARDRIKRAML